MVKAMSAYLDQGKVKLLVNGEHGLVIEFGNVISPEINQFVQQLTRQLHSKPIAGIIEVVPTYRSVTVYFDPLTITRCALSQLVRQMLDGINPREPGGLPSRVVRVPVCYGGVLGPDLDFVARYACLSAQEVIDLHTSSPYLVYMLGFTPGFPYLGGMSEQIAVPRQEKPRVRVPAGSVGIGGNQTGIYPIESPGEWWLIGRTPIKAFDPQSPNPFLVSAGDYLHFFAISLKEYFRIRREVEAGTYEMDISYV
jgi:inhibitor of KinA